MVYDEYKIYGPYLRKDGRKHICGVHNVTRKRITVSYPKYLKEIELNRYLENNETVDHLDNNFTNDDLSNLKVKSRDIHASQDARRLKEQTFNCIGCGKEVTYSGQKLSTCITNRKRGMSGPFCSKSCSGKYGTDLQNGKLEKIEPILIKPEYTTTKKLLTIPA